MNNRRSRKQKIMAQKRQEKLDENIEEIKRLRDKAQDIQERIKKQKRANRKECIVRNLKIFGHTCNFLAPFVISTGLTVGGFCLFDGGLPFHLDEVTKYKTYSLEYQANNDVTLESDYKTNRWFDSSLPSNMVVIYTPWELQGQKYTRTKREYEIGELTTLDLYNAVLDGDMNYINDNLVDYKEEKQVTDFVNLEDNCGLIEASLHIRDEEDFLQYNETEKKNIVVSIAEMIIAACIGASVAYFRDFQYLYELKYTNQEYKLGFKSVEPLKQELKGTEQMILSLQNKGGR